MSSRFHFFISILQLTRLQIFELSLTMVFTVVCFAGVVRDDDDDNNDDDNDVENDDNDL